ncbi:glycosyl hydrolase [Streptomyces sp. NPDC051940]|uniref:glycoside hydrolase family 26 protein n=1 Tax=Streptomyces sp. NPDC051940 TaxID=3155675 RepID=UPI0034241D70
MTSEFGRRTLIKASGALLGAAAAGAYAIPSASALTAGKPPVPGGDLAFLGVYCTPETAGSGLSGPEPLEALLGRQFAVNHSFRSPYGAAWAPVRDRMLADKAAGRIPMLSYAAGGVDDLQALADGQRDALIDGQATALVALDTPVFMRFTWEFDSQTRYAGHAGLFVEAWRYAWERFQLKGATNVAWVWCPTRLAFGNGAASDFYPGNGYVDWIAADGYSRPTEGPPLGPYPSFLELFTEANIFAINHGKPFMVGETGVHRASDLATATEQSSWLDGIRDSLDQGRWANLKALVYYHLDGEGTSLPAHWQVTVPPDGNAFQSFKSLAWHPRMKAVLPG